MLACQEHQDISRPARLDMQGVTWQLTGGVVKNIIPAIASTNAIIAAACALEAVKLLTVCSSGMENYMMCAPTPPFMAELKKPSSP